MSKNSRFDYVAYDKTAQVQQAVFKDLCQQVEDLVTGIGCERWREAALMKLEEFYMCIGKGVRDDQIDRNGGAPLQEARGNE